MKGVLKNFRGKNVLCEATRDAVKKISGLAFLKGEKGILK